MQTIVRVSNQRSGRWVDRWVGGRVGGEGRTERVKVLLAAESAKHDHPDVAAVELCVKRVHDVHLCRPCLVLVERIPPDAHH
jgi:hypothetical protein